MTCFLAKTLLRLRAESHVENLSEKKKDKKTHTHTVHKLLFFKML